MIASRRPISRSTAVTTPRCKSQQRMCRTCRDGAPQLSLESFSSATRQIVGAGRIIEADTIEGFIFRALGGETREEGSSITVTGPKKRYLRLAIYLTWKDAARRRRLGRKLVPHECPDRFPSSSSSSSPGKTRSIGSPVIAPVRPLSSPLLPLPFPPFLELVYRC